MTKEEGGVRSDDKSSIGQGPEEGLAKKITAGWVKVARPGVIGVGLIERDVLFLVSIAVALRRSIETLP